MSDCNQYGATGTGVVTFVYTDWIAQYPQLASISSGAAQGFFNQACLFCDNTPLSIICNLTERTTLLYMVTAHLAQLFGIVNGQVPSGLAGRISNAGEGSVSIGLDYAAATTNLQAFFNQTSYGAAYWAATTKYRTMMYVPNRFNRFGYRRGPF